MLFTSNLFVFLFLPLTIAGYYLLARQFKNLFLLVMSLLFYAWGEPSFVLIMIASILFNYFMALFIDMLYYHHAVKRMLMIITIVGNLGLMFVYKYLDFVIGSLAAFQTWRFGSSWLTPYGFILPIGISFFTFQALSYVIDVYRGTVEVQKKPHNLALYVSFFPQLIAGPIVRYQTIAEQIDGRREIFEDFAIGVKRFIVGFSRR
ncbi:hypothetical protein FACS18948_0610 [Clostridia bacterium]|nr:hypothetical protein FACS18948_0610 [Clostridia bacterium]